MAPMESSEELPWPRCMSWLLCLSWDEADMDSGRAELSLHVGSAQGAAAAPPPPDASMNLQDDLQAGRPVFFRVDLRSAAHEEGCGTPAAAGQTRAPGDENASDGAATKPSEERRPNREKRSKEEPQLPLGVYMACLSLNKVGHCHPKGRCCCGSSNVTAASSSPPTPRDVGSVKTLRSRCSHTEASNYTLVLKPKAVKPRAAGSAQSVPSASAGVEVERPDVASRPGSTPSQFLGSEEGDLSLRAQRPPYSSPNSPVLFTQVQRQSSSPATCENCQRSRSATVESEWQQRRGERKEKPRRRDRSERCCSEEITALSCGEDADDTAMSRPGCAAKKGSRYSLGSCLGSRGQRAFKTGEHRRRFSLTLPSALLNLFRRRRGSSPSVRNSASQTEPYLGEAVCYGAQASGSPYAVRALPPLPAGCSSVCDRLSAASDAASTTSDESDRRSMDYAASIEKVKDCGWYWGPISGETAERLLSQEPDGSFVVRDSSDEHYIFSLTFKLNGLVRHVRIEHDQGGKYSKEGITVMVVTNVLGTEKLPLLVIGKAKNLRCFNWMKKLSVGDQKVQLVVISKTKDSRSFQDPEQLPLWYSSSTKAWITQCLFEDYLHRLYRVVEHQNVDNCGAHGKVEKLKAMRLEFLLPNTTSVLQQMDQGVIQNIKVLHRALLLRHTVLCLDNEKRYSPDLLSMINMFTVAWKAVKPVSIAHCFKHAGFCASEEPVTDDARPDHQEAEDGATALDVGERLFADLRNRWMDIPGATTFHEFADVDTALIRNFSFGCLQKFQSHTIVDFIENAVEHSRSGRYLFFLHRRPILGPMRVQLLHPVSRFKQVQSLQHLCRTTLRLHNTPHYYSEELADLAHPAFASHAFPATLVRDQSLEALFHQS
ncbi:hypothetical protein IscW_ISCW013972 [Ixodes scapularis]|uniref:Uncharacterized protein n=1 Tax=Ixodes scapularis TaxID=6945 RepID=B7QK86_IXOSC|nr:hypothetical protein IscW_ISCW013972 [Ixodes scapularis]|eukprot:XP_002415593.1 hypothetical protein IscW_ISCW013972 [Ixodes scapularis]